MDKYINDRNNHEKVEPFDWNLDLEMNEDWAIWENEMFETTKKIRSAKAKLFKKHKGE